MEEQKKTSTPSTSSGGGGKGDVEIEADDNQQLSPAAQAAIVEVDLQKKMEKARLNEDLVFSNDLVSNTQTCRLTLTQYSIFHVMTSFKNKWNAVY